MHCRDCRGSIATCVWNDICMLLTKAWFIFLYSCYARPQEEITAEIEKNEEQMYEWRFLWSASLRCTVTFCTRLVGFTPALQVRRSFKHKSANKRWRAVGREKMGNVTKTADVLQLPSSCVMLLVSLSAWGFVSHLLSSSSRVCVCVRHVTHSCHCMATGQGTWRAWQK